MCEISLAGSDEGHCLWINAYHLIVEQRGAEGGAFPHGKTHPVARCFRANGGICMMETVKTF